MTDLIDNTIMQEKVKMRKTCQSQHGSGITKVTRHQNLLIYLSLSEFGKQLAGYHKQDLCRFDNYI